MLRQKKCWAPPTIKMKFKGSETILQEGEKARVDTYRTFW